MNGTYFKKLSRALALSAVCLAFAPGKSEAVGPITSRLNKVLLYFYNYGTDHTNTIAYVAYVKALGAANGFTVDTTRSQGVFTQTNLANYDVLFLFSAYYFGRAMSASQKGAVESWYAGNKGIACFHQCVRNEWGGTAPNWYDQLMGPTYATYAGFGVGPVYVDSAAAGTDLAMSSAGAQYPPGYRITWDDEWYTYTSRPETHPNTKKILTTRKSEQSGKNWNASQGEVITMAWSREILGGRYVLSSFFHTDQPRTSTVDTLRKFIDGHYLGVLRYLAGYTGCTDSTNVNYNPKATHNDPAVCGAVSVKFADRTGNESIIFGNLSVSFAGKESHWVEVYTMQGKKVASAKGRGPRQYKFPQIKQSGFYVMKAGTPGKSLSKKVFVL
ncbi:MAG: glycosyl hydrolase [Fibrobacteria bacterium]|jgi:hypothetical protein|nr:glycosyl hydrolase [Fibrobacteria bacterium]